MISTEMSTKKDVVEKGAGEVIKDLLTALLVLIWIILKLVWWCAGFLWRVPIRYLRMARQVVTGLNTRRGWCELRDQLWHGGFYRLLIVLAAHMCHLRWNVIRLPVSVTKLWIEEPTLLTTYLHPEAAYGYHVYVVICWLIQFLRLNSKQWTNYDPIISRDNLVETATGLCPNFHVARVHWQWVWVVHNTVELFLRRKCGDDNKYIAVFWGVGCVLLMAAVGVYPDGDVVDALGHVHRERFCWAEVFICILWGSVKLLVQWPRGQGDLETKSDTNLDPLKDKMLMALIAQPLEDIMPEALRYGNKDTYAYQNIRQRYLDESRLLQKAGKGDCYEADASWVEEVEDRFIVTNIGILKGIVSLLQFRYHEGSLSMELMTDVVRGLLNYMQITRVQQLRELEKGWPFVKPHFANALCMLRMYLIYNPEHSWFLVEMGGSWYEKQEGRGVRAAHRGLSCGKKNSRRYTPQFYGFARKLGLACEQVEEEYGEMPGFVEFVSDLHLDDVGPYAHGNLSASQELKAYAAHTGRDLTKYIEKAQKHENEKFQKMLQVSQVRQAKRMQAIAEKMKVLRADEKIDTVQKAEPAISEPKPVEPVEISDTDKELFDKEWQKIVEFERNMEKPALEATDVWADEDIVMDPDAIALVMEREIGAEFRYFGSKSLSRRHKEEGGDRQESMNCPVAFAKAMTGKTAADVLTRKLGMQFGVVNRVVVDGHAMKVNQVDLVQVIEDHAAKVEESSKIIDEIKALHSVVEPAQESTGPAAVEVPPVVVAAPGVAEPTIRELYELVLKQGELIAKVCAVEVKEKKKVDPPAPAPPLITVTLPDESAVKTDDGTAVIKEKKKKKSQQQEGVVAGCNPIAIQDIPSVGVYVRRQDKWVFVGNGGCYQAGSGVRLHTPGHVQSFSNPVAGDVVHLNFFDGRKVQAEVLNSGVWSENFDVVLSSIRLRVAEGEAFKVPVLKVTASKTVPSQVVSYMYSGVDGVLDGNWVVNFGPVTGLRDSTVDGQHIPIVKVKWTTRAGDCAAFVYDAVGGMVGCHRWANVDGQHPGFDNLSALGYSVSIKASKIDPRTAFNEGVPAEKPKQQGVEGCEVPTVVAKGWAPGQFYCGDLEVQRKVQVGAGVVDIRVPYQHWMNTPRLVSRYGGTDKVLLRDNYGLGTHNEGLYHLRIFNPLDTSRRNYISLADVDVGLSIDTKQHWTLGTFYDDVAGGSRQVGVNFRHFVAKPSVESVHKELMKFGSEPLDPHYMEHLRKAMDVVCEEILELQPISAEWVTVRDLAGLIFGEVGRLNLDSKTGVSDVNRITKDFVVARGRENFNSKKEELGIVGIEWDDDQCFTQGLTDLCFEAATILLETRENIATDFPFLVFGKKDGYPFKKLLGGGGRSIQASDLLFKLIWNFLYGPIADKWAHLDKEKSTHCHGDFVGEDSLNGWSMHRYKKVMGCSGVFSTDITGYDRSVSSYLNFLYIDKLLCPAARDFNNSAWFMTLWLSLNSTILVLPWEPPVVRVGVKFNGNCSGRSDTLMFNCITNRVQSMVLAGVAACKIRRMRQVNPIGEDLNLGVMRFVNRLEEDDGFMDYRLLSEPFDEEIDAFFEELLQVRPPVYMEITGDDNRTWVHSMSILEHNSRVEPYAPVMNCHHGEQYNLELTAVEFQRLVLVLWKRYSGFSVKLEGSAVFDTTVLPHGDGQLVVGCKFDDLVHAPHFVGRSLYPTTIKVERVLLGGEIQDEQFTTKGKRVILMPMADSARTLRSAYMGSAGSTPEIISLRREGVAVALNHNLFLHLCGECVDLNLAHCVMNFVPFSRIPVFDLFYTKMGVVKRRLNNQLEEEGWTAARNLGVGNDC